MIDSVKRVKAQVLNFGDAVDNVSSIFIVTSMTNLIQTQSVKTILL